MKRQLHIDVFFDFICPWCLIGKRQLQAALTQMKQSHPDVDAIFFCNDDLAQGALLMALRMGIKVPQQIAVAGFNDLNGSDQMLPALSTVRTPRSEIGTAAAQMLLALIKGKAVPQSCLDLGYQLIVRESTMKT